jgi:uncharacterized RDD family membrane protein YckC
MSDAKGWYYLRDGGSVGPESSTHILELLDAGAVTRSTWLWRDGAADWQPLETALGLIANRPPPLPGTPPPGMPPIPKESDVRSIPPAKLTRYSDFSPHPWRRYFARMLDTSVGAALMFFAIGVILFALSQDEYKEFFDWLSKPENRAISAILSFCLAMFPNALFIGFTGSSLGKSIFGVSVTHLDRKPIGFRLALYREVLVWTRGLWLGIPLLSVIPLINSFRKLNENRKTSWDNDLSLTVPQRPETRIQIGLSFFGVVLWFCITFALVELNNV